MSQRGPAGRGKFEKPAGGSAKVLRRLWQYLMGYKYLMLLAAALAIGSNFLSLLGPKLSGNAISAIEPGAGKVDFQTVFYYASLMLIFYVVSSVMSYLLSFIMLKLSRGVVYRMRRDVFERLTNLPIGFFDTHQTGDVISVISYDIDTVNASLANDAVQMLSSFITVFGSLFMMLTISPKLCLVFALTIPISVIFTRYRSKKVRPLYRVRSKKLGEMNGFVEEVTSGQKTTRAYGQEKVFISRFAEKNGAAVEGNYQADRFASSAGPVVTFINNLSLALVSMFGALLYMTGHIGLGAISSFVLYSRSFSGPVNEFANIISELQSALAAAERVFRLLDEPTEGADREGAKALSDVRGEVAVKGVTFGYSKDMVILKNVTLDAEPGKVVAIVGPTGSGKTTIINLLMRFYDVTDGSIRVDGLDVRDAQRKSLRLAYAMVLQDTWLFHGTIYENIAYGREGVTMEEVVAAAKAARIHRYISALPDGYDTVLSDNGVNISKGQKQLLTIARAMLLDARMLILDEATSNVDTQTERRIQSAMLSLMKGRTSFVIAHRLSTIQNADVILVVKDGEIVERGKHDELMRQNGYYREMYDAQFDSAC